jgi:ATP-dependent Clp protease ATP-binding subunit ClpC
MTSNIGTEETGKSLGFVSRPDQLPDYSAHLGRFFRPEFLNRVDEIITFHALTPETMSKILDLQLEELLRRLENQKLRLELDADARALILKKGYDPINGARPLRRAIERLLTRPVSAHIVEDAFQPGDTILVRADGDDRLRFEPVRQAN